MLELGLPLVFVWLCYGFRWKQRSGKFHHVLELFIIIVDVWMRGLVGHNIW